MESHRWTEIKALFEAALELAPEGRATYLDEVCVGDASLRHEVESLLASDDAASDFLDTPVIRPPSVPLARASLIGQKIGPYHILRELAHGGMGAIYLAERADGAFEQTVALKLVRSGLDSDDLLSRFRYERQILAALDHPNIAHLLDGGMTKDGRPYFVMEYVDGLPITSYCDQHCLSTQQRLTLFRTVCRAVQYAHQNLVVHRDLKPSNILVTEEGTVKLLDFGIAKLLDEEAEATTTPQTQTGLRLMTPEYASPEQVRGVAITTATDVYQLGVLLYELLTGHRPYRIADRVRHEVERVILEEEPTRPSTVIRKTKPIGTGPSTTLLTPEEVSAARGTSIEGLHRRLSGDLDMICLMALKKEPGRRYASVEHFSEDIRRHLSGLPVAAHKDSFGYRLSRFIHRHKVGVTATGLVVIALVAGLAGTTWQARVAERERAKAEQRFDDLRQLSTSFLFEFHDAIVDLPGSTAARELVVKRALEYLDKLAQQADDPSLQVELATAYRKVGDVQGNPTNANLGQTEGAMDSYRKALSIAQSALNTSESGNARQTIALIQERLSDVLAATGDLEQADAQMQDAVAQYRTIAHTQSEDAEKWTQYAIGLIKWGDLTGNPNFANREQPQVALEHYRAARPILDSLYAVDATLYNVARLRGLIHERLGTIYENLGDQEAALEAYRTSLELREAYAATQAENVDVIRDLAIAHEKMGDMSVRADNLEEALARYQRATEIFESLQQADPENVQARQSVAISYLHLGDVHGYPEQPNLGNRPEALKHYQNAQAILKQLYDQDPSNTHLSFLVDYVQKRIVTVQSST